MYVLRLTINDDPIAGGAVMLTSVSCLGDEATAWVYGVHLTGWQRSALAGVQFLRVFGAVFTGLISPSSMVATVEKEHTAPEQPTRDVQPRPSRVSTSRAYRPRRCCHSRCRGADVHLDLRDELAANRSVIASLQVVVYTLR